MYYFNYHLVVKRKIYKPIFTVGSMIRRTKNKSKSYYVSLPEGLRINSYADLRLEGETSAASGRQAVSYVISRQNGKNRNIVGLVMDELDRNYGGAECYAFEESEFLPQVIVYQTPEDLRQGEKLTSEDRALLTEHAQAYELAKRAGADTGDPRVRFHYFDRVRRLKQR